MDLAVCDQILGSVLNNQTAGLPSRNWPSDQILFSVLDVRLTDRSIEQLSSDDADGIRCITVITGLQHPANLLDRIQMLLSQQLAYPRILQGHLCQSGSGRRVQFTCDLSKHIYPFIVEYARRILSKSSLTATLVFNSIKSLC